VAAFREEHNLDDPLVTQYLRWVGGLLTLDLGESFRSADRPVLDEILRRIPVTFELTVVALAVSLLISFPAGIISAVKQDSIVDYISRVLSMAGLAIPSFVMGSLMISLPVIWFGWIPPLRYPGFTANPIDNLGQVVVPAIALGLGLAGSVTRMIRSQLLDVLRQDYIRT